MFKITLSAQVEQRLLPTTWNTTKALALLLLKSVDKPSSNLIQISLCLQHQELHTCSDTELRTCSASQDIHQLSQLRALRLLVSRFLFLQAYQDKMYTFSGSLPMKTSTKYFASKSSFKRRMVCGPRKLKLVTEQTSRFLLKTNASFLF